MAFPLESGRLSSRKMLILNSRDDTELGAEGVIRSRLIPPFAY